LNPILKKTLSIAIPMLIGVGLIVWQYNQFNQEQLLEIKNYFKTADYRYIVISTVLSVVSLASRGYRWKYSLAYMGYQSSFINNFLAVNISYFMNLTIPRSGEVSRALVLKRYDNIPFDKGFGTIIAERIIDLVLLVLFVLMALVLEFKALKSFLTELIPFEKLLILGVIGVVGFFVFVYLMIYSKNAWFLWFKNKISGLVEGLLSVFKMPNKWWFLFHTLVIWGSYLYTFYIAVFALPETSGVTFGQMSVAFIAGSLAVTFTNGGIGAFPVFTAQALFLFGIAMTAGTAFGWILWASQTALLIILGGLSFMLLPLFNKK